jgi:hypothetical protein
MEISEMAEDNLIKFSEAFFERIRKALWAGCLGL